MQNFILCEITYKQEKNLNIRINLAESHRSFILQSIAQELYQHACLYVRDINSKSSQMLMRLEIFW